VEDPDSIKLFIGDKKKRQAFDLANYNLEGGQGENNQIKTLTEEDIR